MTSKSLSKAPVALPLAMSGVLLSLSWGTPLARAQSATPTLAPTPTPVTAPDPASSTPLDWARWLVANLSPEENTYATSPSYVTFPIPDRVVPAEARTMCSSFFTALLAQAYGFNENYFRSWTGGRAPTAARWFATAKAGRQFTRISRVIDVRPGDVLLVDYGDPTASSTGHIALIDSMPQIRFPQSAPLVPDTIQYEVGVIDSARTGHGPTDSRRMADGSWVSGVGRGVMRLYVDNQGTIVGYAWSVWASSSYGINGDGTSQTLVARVGFP